MVAGALVPSCHTRQYPTANLVTQYPMANLVTGANMISLRLLQRFQGSELRADSVLVHKLNNTRSSIEVYAEGKLLCFYDIHPEIRPPMEATKWTKIIFYIPIL